MKKMRTGFLMMCALGAMASVPEQVGAASKIIPGTICNPYNAGQANDIDYVASGVRTTATSVRQVICAVPREFTVDGAFVSVNGTLTGSNTMPLTLFSYDTIGTFLGSDSGTGSSGTFGVGLNLTNAQAPAGAILSVLAQLPASSGGTLFAAIPDH